MSIEREIRERERTAFMAGHKSTMTLVRKASVPGDQSINRGAIDDALAEIYPALPDQARFVLRARGLVLSFESDGLHIRHEGALAGTEIGFVPL